MIGFDFSSPREHAMNANANNGWFVRTSIPVVSVRILEILDPREILVQNSKDTSLYRYTSLHYLRNIKR